MPLLSGKDLTLGIGFLVCLLALAFAPEQSLLAGALTVAAGGLVFVHVLLGDEVERARNLSAAGFAFTGLSAGLLALTAIGQADLIARQAGNLWAVCFALFILSWGGLRLIRG